MNTTARNICTSCNKEITVSNIPLSPMIVKVNYERYRIAYCRSCAERVDKVLSEAMKSVFSKE